ncbi:MAG: hypothetical protein Q8N14_05790, partial [Candidatus Omnitrophota bacterium]|nr:hypothetical protein [Candidatus Omnitrophota bacterium]
IPIGTHLLKKYEYLAQQDTQPYAATARVSFHVIQVKMKGRSNERKKFDYREKGILKKYWQR